MLEAAEAILVRDGIAALTLRAAARAAGVSHAAPKNHFGDLSGLLSELAAVGYRRLADMMQAASGGAAASAGAGRAYVKFAIANPGLFQLMFRGERLDYGRPALKEASDRAFGFLMCDPVPRDGAEALDLDAAAGILQRWSAVHGLAMLLIDQRLEPILARLPEGTRAEDLLGVVARRMGAPRTEPRND